MSSPSVVVLTSSSQLDFLWRRDGGRRRREWRALPLLILDRMVPSAAVGGASKEAGPSSAEGEGMTGVMGVGVEGVVVAVVEGVEPEEGVGKVGGRSLKPGLFGEGSSAVGERARLACSFSIRAEFLLALAGRGEVIPAGGSWSSVWVLGSCKERGGRRLTGFSVSCPAASCGGAEPLNRPASSATEHRDEASSSILLVVHLRPRLCQVCVSESRPAG